MQFCSAPHAQAMALIHAASFPPFDVWDATVMAEQLVLPGMFGLIDEQGGFILTRVAADEAEILTIAVIPSARRQGLGSALLEAAIAEAARRGAAAMFLDVSANNRAASDLYERHAFTEVGLRRRYYADGSDARVMRRDLRQL